MARYRNNRMLLLLLLAILPIASVWASTESYIQTLSGKIKKGDSCTVIDDKFLNMPLSDWNQVRHLTVENIITFELRRDTSVYYQKKPFTCTLNITIKYFTSRDETNPKEIDNIDMAVKFDTATGKYYPVSASYKFKNAFKVTVIVNSISSAELGKDLPPVFRISNQILVERKYPFDKTKAPPMMISLSGISLHSTDSLMNSLFAGNVLASRGPALGQNFNMLLPAAAPPPNPNNQLTISWQTITGIEEYDIEWTYIDLLGDRGKAIQNNPAWFDGTQLLNIPAASEAAWMQNDNTRVTVKGTSYTIDLPYMSGFILTRVRGVSYDVTNNLRLVTPWQYTDAANNNYTAGAFIDAHQPTLNWQYTSSFSEEGKRKEIISYFDASLRERQMVTINNNDLDHASVKNIAVVGETIYDNMGRATLNILPSPISNTVLQFYPGINKNAAGDPYSRDDIGSVGTNPDGSCNITAAPMNTSSGASQYYSSNNSFLPNTTDYFYAKYIPDAGGRPFTLEEYTSDNTGRTRRRGGVGPTLQIGTGHDTRMYYSKPNGPRDLERLFGMEAGDFSHYEKNMLVDPNGQVHVSYMDANSKIVATALAGDAPPNLDALPSATGAGAKTSFNQVLIQPSDFIANPGGLYKSSSTTFSAPFIGSYTLHFTVSPALAVTPSPNGSTSFCSNCYYDITIDVKDNCGTLVAHDYPATPPFPGSDISCHDNPQAYTGDLVIPINNIGEYTVIYTLKLSEAQIKYQTDYYIGNNSSLRKIQNFFEDILPTVDLTGCYDECSTCKAKLGSLNDFTQKMQALLIAQKAEKYPNAPESNFDPNSPAITAWIGTTYQGLYNHCISIQANCSSGSACEQKKQMMKSDVEPGGQYALYDQSALDANAAQVFQDRAINVPLLHYTSMPEYFNDDNGNQVHAVDDNGNLASGLSEADFIRAYQNHLEWADYFVQFHIEYCSYLWCKDQGYPTPAANMEASYNFDQNLRQVFTTADLAAGLGYFDHNNNLALLSHDPFFGSTGRGAAYQSRMAGELQTYSASQNIVVKDASGNALPGKDIIGYIDWILYCQPGTGATTAQYLSSWQSCSPDPNCRSASQEWQLYRNYYLQLKSKYVQIVKDSINPTCRNCFVGNDGLNTADPPTCITMKGSPSNPNFQFDGMASYSNDGCATCPDLMAAGWTCNAFGVPHCNFRALFKYDVSSIPANATISSATLTLYANTSSVNGLVGSPTYSNAGGANAAWLQRVTSPWSAPGTGWNNLPSYSTSDALTLPASTSTTQNYTVDLKSFVSQWVANPSSNYGMLLQLKNEINYNSLIFGGPGAPDAIQPVLQICYTTGGSGGSVGINSPVTAALAACNATGSSGGSTPPPSCPAYTDFGVQVVNYPSTPTSQTLDCKVWDYEEWVAYNGGNVATDVNVVVTGVNTVTNPESGSLISTFSNDYTVTIPAGQHSARIGFFTHAQPPGGASPTTECNDFNWSFSIKNVAPVCTVPPVAPVSPPSSCTSDPNYLSYKGKTRVFNDYVDQSCLNQQGVPYATDNSSTGYSTASLDALRQATVAQLDALKAGWFSRLQAVRDEEFNGNAALSDAVLTNLTNELYKVAQAYVNVATETNMRAASTLPPGVSVDGYTSFKDVFTAIIGGSLMGQGFSQDLLDKPYPYNKNNFDVDPQISETTAGICSNLTNFRTNWTSSGSSLSFPKYLAQVLGDDYNLTDDQLTDMQNKCAAACLHGYLNAGIAIPVAFAADPSNHPVQSCSMINGLAATFAANYPGVTLADKPKLYKLLFTNFMNLSTGYSLSYYEYADFQTACSANATAILYDKPASPQTPPDDFLCTAGIMQGVFSQAGMEYDRYIEIIRRQFRNSYISNCLANQAGANMSGQNWEYHYTLFYYDQSGNMVKTIPPEGVQLLTDDQIDLVEQLGTQDPSSCSAFPSSVLTDKNTILNDLSASLQNNSAQALEMWLYSTAGPSTRQLRMITPDNKYMYQAAIANNKLWVELYTLSPGAAGSGDISITLSNQAVADLSATLPLQSWTHLVIESADGLVGGNLQFYLDGVKLPMIANGAAPPYPYDWEIDAGYTLPTEDIAALKHIRVYNRIATDAEITADFKNSCLSPVGALAGTPLSFWGRFDIPSFCNNDGTATPVTIQDRGSLNVSANPFPDGSNLTHVFTSSPNTFTVEFWINPQTPENFYDGEDEDIFAGSYEHNYVITPYWGGLASTQTAGMGVSVGTNGVAVFEHADSYMPAMLLWQHSISGWTHVAVVYNNRTPSLYINGVYVATGNTSTKTFVNPSYNLGGGGYGYMVGNLDEVRIWNTARTADQLYSNYTKTISPDNMAGLLGYWPMDAFNGSVIKDITCNHNDVPFASSAEAWTTNVPAITEINYVEYASRFIVPNHGMPTNYVYNSLNQVIQQTTPESGVSYFWYDRLGRVTASQNAEQRTPLDPADPANRYGYTLYDPIGRTSEVGEKINIPAGAAAMSEDLARTPSLLTSWLGLGNNRQVTVSAFDQKPAWSPGNIPQSNLRKRVAATALLSQVANPALPTDPSQNRQSASYYTYDIDGHISTLVQENTAQVNSESQLVHGTDGLTGYKTIQYDYDLISGKVNKVMYQPGKWDQFNYQFTYDADNRLLRSVTRREGADGDPAGSLWTPEAAYTYYPHGPLARKELGDQVQGMDYAYTLHGWLKGVNSSSLNSLSDMSQDGMTSSGGPFAPFARDAIAFGLGYYQGDYTPIGNSTGANAFAVQYQSPAIASPASSGKDLFTGNINAATYALSKLENSNTVGYTYRYDQLHRLKAMDRHNILQGAASWDNSSIIADYAESISYDANGNIKTYLRNGTTAEGLPMDNLNYGYNLDANGRLVNNKLRSVKDNVTNSSDTYDDIKDGQTDDNYTYDHIGNMVGDEAEGVDAIKWNVYGKIESIVKGTGITISYVYDASGHRISKSVKDVPNNATVTTHYVRDADGNVLAVYSYKFAGNAVQPTEGSWLEQDLYGSDRLGILNPNVKLLASAPLASDSYAANTNIGPAQGILGLRTYELSNHLGNVLATISDKKIGVVSTSNPGLIDHYDADVLTMQDYYPFGMIMPARKWTNGTNYRYGFNGKENDDEVEGVGNQVDYGMRVYDPRVGRFLSVDPLQKDYPELSVYQYASNSPIESVDLDGLEQKDYMYIERATTIDNRLRIAYKFDNGKVIQMQAQRVTGSKVDEQRFPFWRAVRTLGWAGLIFEFFTSPSTPPQDVAQDYPQYEGNPEMERLFWRTWEGPGRRFPLPPTDPAKLPQWLNDYWPEGMPLTLPLPVTAPNPSPNPETAPKPKDDDDDDDKEDVYLYRAGSFSDKTFTPRPGQDDDMDSKKPGLSTFTTPEEATQGKGGVVQKLSAKKLLALGFHLHVDGTHVGILPGGPDQAHKLKEWAATRLKLQDGQLGQPSSHNLTKLAQTTREGQVKVPPLKR